MNVNYVFQSGRYMSLDEITYPLRAFYYNNTKLSIAIFIVLVIFSIFKPKQIGKMLVGVAILAGIAYLVGSLSSTVSKGIDKKDQGTHRTDKAYKESDQ